MSSDGQRQATLVPPAVAALKEEANEDLATRGHMERSVSQDIREEREDLKRAAEQSANAIMDLNLDGAIRWASPSWEQLTGMSPDSLRDKKICDIITSDHKALFTDAIESMRKDDSKSRIIRFNVACQQRPKTAVQDNAEGSDSQDRLNRDAKTADASETTTGEIGLEAQGIMVYDRSTGEESHTMWMIKPAIPREITIDLPEMLVESLGIGAHVLAQYLNTLTDSSVGEPSTHPPPMPVLCRICERSITPWWFEKHTELCLQEHRAEMEIQMAHETLTEHRSAIVKVLDALEAQAKRVRASSNDTGSPAPGPSPEYKGLPIGPPSQPTSATSSGPSSGRNSPAVSQSRGRESSTSGFGHHRARSFAVRRPLARIVELVLDLCDTAMEINTPSIKEANIQDGAEIRTQSPSSDNRIAQVMQWQSPSASTLESEEGLSLLCDDTQNMCKAKVDAVFRCRRFLEYSERIRVEFDILVQECIDEALAKAQRIVAGEISDASEGSSSDSDSVDEDALKSPEAPEKIVDSAPARKPIVNAGPQSLAMALRNTSDTFVGRAHGRRESSTGASTRSNSPMGSRTPRSMVGSMSSIPVQQKRGSVVFESDAGAESDSSFRSSLASASRRADSPSTDLSLSRVASARGRKRTSLALPSLQGGSRQESPVRGHVPPPLSPLRSFKPRVQSGESSASPITSPLQTASEFTSPVIKAQHIHHRRQSSVTLNDAYRNAPSSPRLSAIVSNPQQPKPTQTSIKDFEIIKPISKGAFGSVYLAKKKVTGDYYAIKVLKKGDMVAKNQVTNVKAERAIMMWQGESDFVAKLYWTFASKDFLYLVMEYLNGGDCASLIKTLGGLPEDWAKKYLAEVVLGVQHLHSRQIVHRDLKPDNLLIDQKGHLKLTDFGLSRMGLVGRQKRMQNGRQTEGPNLEKHNPFRRAPSIASSRSTSFDFNGQHSPVETPSLTPAMSNDFSQPSYFSLNREHSREPARRTSSHRSDSGDSDALQALFRRFSLADEALMANPPRQTPIEEETGSEGDSPDGYTLQSVMSNSSHLPPPAGTPPQPTAMPPPPMALFDPEDNSRRFVGTPDYLAPETINGVGQDEMSDWWSLGCILFESLYGYPPFHAPTPEEVFQNILARKIFWPEPDEDCASDEAKDLINKLLVLDPKERLGANNDDKYANGGDEIRAHLWFSDIDWDTLREDEASFVPQPTHAEDTEYFDARGATAQNFSHEFEDQTPSPMGTPGADYPDRPYDALSRVRMKVNSIKRGLMPLHIPPHVRDGRSRRSSEPTAPDDFGNFQFKNLPVLEKANKDVLSKLRAEALQAQSKSNQVATAAAAASKSADSSAIASAPSLEASPVFAGSLKRGLSVNKHIRPASPLLLGQTNPSPNRQSQPSSPLLVSFSANHHERRKTSSGSSNLSHSASSSLQPGSFFDVPKLLKAQSVASSPVKLTKQTTVPLAPPKEDLTLSPRGIGGSSPRQRAHTVGDNDNHDLTLLKRASTHSHQKRHSQVFDVSPSSSDTEDQRQKALLRVQRRRQSSRRLSQITLSEGPMFRPLDVLICEDHPVSRLVMERLLEKLRCRTISVLNGTEAMRYAMSEVKFDVIMMEFKLPQINGADVARMIRETKNANTHTPIVAVTGYLKELMAPHDFDALVEKPPDTGKLSEVLGRLCMWKPPPPGWTPAMMGSGLRKSSTADVEGESPTSTTASAVFSTGSRAVRVGSREESVTSAEAGSVDGGEKMERIPTIIRQVTEEKGWGESAEELERQFGGLGIDDGEARLLTPRQMPGLVEQRSAPAVLETGSRKDRSPSLKAEEAVESEEGDDEDDEMGNVNVRARSPKKKTEKGGSKLATEMLRTNSQGSVVSGDEGKVKEGTMMTSAGEVGTPPQVFREEGEGVGALADEDMTPRPIVQVDGYDPDPTPRKTGSPTRGGH
ncbi:Serine/threonine-protein kinase ppk18 [Sphaceloma murrayae]|uniref:non-specific serine/threonine protein kinase n=1 Tax=Sphaceloma murrayae TaxID=2082308 RepID=A0A2K1QL49_9PEZI|nr:Serine/threonine-protein kinase ppk18 [Sphaceloma murrayae]